MITKYTAQRYVCAVIMYSCLFMPLFAENLRLQDIGVADLIAQNPSITYIPCDQPRPFDYPRYPFMQFQHLHPHQGSFAKTFILKIPHGRAQSCYGWVIVDNSLYISEMNWKSLYHHTSLIDQVEPDDITPIAGRVVVLGQPGFYQYWHWVSEILSRLALVEQNGVEYDWLYVPYYNTFMKQTLNLWGIDPSKIIEPSGKLDAIYAEELIVPSLVSSLHYGFAPYSCYPSYHLYEYVAEKLLHAALAKQPICHISPRIFISRNDAPGRHVINEDDVFALFEPHGFVRYELSNLSIVDQIHLFYNAEIIAGPAGTGITANSLYCKPETKVIELFQALGDSTMWFVAQEKKLAYTGVQTTDFAWDYVNCFADTTMSLEPITRMIADLECNNLQICYRLEP